MELFKEVGESVNDWLKLTVDYQENNKTNKVPMLDVEVWVEDNNNLKYQFYEKEVSSKRVIGAKSAMAQSSKISTLSQEVVRRMQNTARDVNIESRIEILSKFMAKLKRSGYNERVRRSILEAGINGYYNKVAREMKGGAKVNNDSRKNKAKNKINKIIMKDKWHMKNNTNNEDEEQT